MIGDRGYGSKVGITHVLDNKSDFLVRIRNKAMILMGTEDKQFNLLEHFKKLEIGDIGDWDVLYNPEKNKWVKIRLCAVKKSPEAAEYSIKKVKQEMSKKQRTISEDTLELHAYFFVITSVERDVLTSKEIVELYRFRWQVELAFKRLKSIFGLGHLPKTDPDSAKAWLHGKLVVALLANLIVEEGRCFSPWGYPLKEI
jgi:IS4 transposase